MSTYPGTEPGRASGAAAAERSNRSRRSGPPVPPGDAGVLGSLAPNEGESHIGTLPPFDSSEEPEQPDDPGQPEAQGRPDGSGQPGEPTTMEVSFSEIVEVNEPRKVLAAAAPEGSGAAPGSTLSAMLPDEVSPDTQREAWLVFEHCPCPLFRLDGRGRLQLANAALAQFLGATREELVGVALHRTPLGRIYPELKEDLDGCLATRSPLQRVVSYQVSVQQSVRFLLWIVPFSRHAGRSDALSGIILPYPG
jgi:PAS domain-containing protein